MCAGMLIAESPLTEHSSLGKVCLQNSSEESHCFIYPRMANYFKTEKSPFISQSIVAQFWKSPPYGILVNNRIQC